MDNLLIVLSNLFIYLSIYLSIYLFVHVFTYANLDLVKALRIVMIEKVISY